MAGEERQDWIEKVFDKLINRRRFISGSVVKGAAVAAALVGFARPVRSGSMGSSCCDLCFGSEENCAGGCEGTAWEWPCCDGGVEYMCFECGGHVEEGDPPVLDCGFVSCSEAWASGSC